MRRKILTQAGALMFAGGLPELAAPAEANNAKSDDSSAGSATLRDVGPGRKFAPSGQVQHWPGCTLICHIPRPGPAFEALCEARDLLRTVGVNRRKLSWLPEHSYHMTVIDLLNESHRGPLEWPGDWPAAIPQDTPLDIAYRRIGDLLRTTDLGSDKPFRLVLDDVLAREGIRTDGYPRTGVPWVPVDAAELRRLRALRDRVSDAVGIRHRDHDGYRFHTSLAYPIARFTPAEAANYQQLYVTSMQHIRHKIPVLELGAPEFCLFESMYFFDRQFDLQVQST